LMSEAFGAVVASVILLFALSSIAAMRGDG